MRGSCERVRRLLRGEAVDRPPVYELLRNDAVISYFAGEAATPENAADVVYRAYGPAVDATRPRVRLPQHEASVRLADGRLERRFRWTSWTEHVPFEGSERWAAGKRAFLDACSDAWGELRQADLDGWLSDVADQRTRLGEVFFFPAGPGIGLMGLYGEIGLEAFSYVLADAPGVVEELLEAAALEAEAWIAHLPPNHGIEAVFCGDDLAGRGGPLVSPAWLRKRYLPRLARVCSAYHRRGIRVLFHSDGNLMPILDGLVEAGIDGLNPIEVQAGMEVGDVHRRHPRLFLAGGIDVAHLLPRGTAEEVREAVRRAIGEAEGRLMVGSSTELDNTVPLGNWLALREAALGAT